jgi:hypothetical protein
MKDQMLELVEKLGRRKKWTINTVPPTGVKLKRTLPGGVLRKVILFVRVDDLLRLLTAIRSNRTSTI